MNEEFQAIEAIRELLTAPDAPAGIAVDAGDRIYPVYLPEEEVYPCIVYSQLQEDVISTKDGTITNGWDFQVSIFAKEYLVAQRLARLCRRAIDLKQVTIGDEEIGTVQLRYKNQADGEYQEDKNLFEIMLDFRAY